MTKAEPLDRLLDEENFDAFMMRESSDDPNMYYLTQFPRSDPFIFLRKDGESTIIVSRLEHSRAKEEAEADNVLSTGDFDLEESEDGQKALIEQIVERFDIRKLAVPQDFPLKTAEDIREHVDLEPVDDHVMEARKIKSDEEVEKLRTAQKATEESMKHVESIIGEAEVESGELHLEGEPLTSERMRRNVRKFLLEKDCSTPEGMIVACGKDSAKPHSTGSGILKVGEPIVVDIFPEHDNRYFGDMTRTFIKGGPSKEVKEMKEAVLEAQKAAFEVLDQGAGIKASEVHRAVCDVLEEHGYATLRQGDTDSGFIHSTGHAVGLSLHEPPGISEKEEELEAGNVLTIEPGLYLPETGGVRIEDMILLKENGYENFNSMHKELEIN